VPDEVAAKCVMSATNNYNVDYVLDNCPQRVKLLELENLQDKIDLCLWIKVPPEIAIKRI
jgi:hypothetical protein